ncbi:zinc-ribbon domain-containing protein [Salinibacillus kushneri]|uniref:Zinc-ribbon domain-containing protein n=1 Tax=Salinibacillus kushneri TaxID=237682 RepID=A0A1I0HBC2_9BACI|nr:zinc ribbon domain-containing protein [Salinibacillus kushneri]SET81057.1 zinc-ribbon domain-containing protein [Salinibacillus kushneri]
MHCPQCGTPNDQDAKFCISCGTKLEQAAMNIERNSQEDTYPQEEPNIQTQANTQSNQYVTQGKEIGRNYLHFIPDAIKHPFETSKKVHESDQVNAIITVILFALLLPLYFYTATNKMTGGYIQVPFFDVVLKPFLILLIFFAALIAVIFAISKLMKVELPFLKVLTQFGTLMVVPTALLLLSLLFLLLSINMFSTIILFLSLALFSISMTATLFTVKSYQYEEGGLDVVYGILLTNIAVVIIMMIIGDSIIGNLMEQLNGGPSFYGF